MINDLFKVGMILVLFYIIYNLITPEGPKGPDGFANVKKELETEPEIEPDSEQEPDSEEEQEPDSEEQDSEQDTTSKDISMNKLKDEIPKYIQTNIEDKVSDELVNQVLNDSVSNTNIPKSTTSPVSIFNYEPNDDEDIVGANLDSAFDKPISSCVDKDIVDINRNNVKNYNAKDFLPKEVNDDWFNTEFSQAKYKMNDDKLINTEKYIIGINTVGQSLKNASYDIRGAVNVPKYSVSPWNNSTTEPDYNIKNLY